MSRKPGPGRPFKRPGRYKQSTESTREARWSHVVTSVCSLVVEGTLTLEGGAEVLGVHPKTMRELIAERRRRAA